MPGRHLNQIERDLDRFWQQPPANFPKPLLRHLRIEGGPGLRGIRDLIIPLPYPFTAICGRNGVGKSTALALAAISARSPAGWQVYWGNARQQRAMTRAEYRFTDFFMRRAGDPTRDGLTLGWAHADRGNELEARRRFRGSSLVGVVDEGRNRVTRQPEREIDFVPVSRILPAIEHGALRSAFRAHDGDNTVLDAAHLAMLSHIMGRPYVEAHTRSLRGLTLPGCRTDVDYSAFDMGAGEASLVTILSRLQRLPAGGLLLVEELELGLHPEAQARLVESLLRVCRDRRIQIICTTHSDVVLDRLPRIARVLMRRSGGAHEAVPNVSTRFAFHEMGGAVGPELQIYTEDRFAAMLVEEAVGGAARSRIRVSDIGSNATLARQAVAHLRGAGGPQSLTLFDGDCSTNEIDQWIASERGDRHDLQPEYQLLPADGLPPERWVLSQLALDPYTDALATQLDCSIGQARDHIENLAAQLDHHSTGFVLGGRTGLDPVEASKRIIRAIANHPALDPIRDRVVQVLG